MTMRPGRSITPTHLSDEDRHHGLVALNLIGTWDDWIKRRVESIELVSETTVLRKVSVDFRMRPWLPDPIVSFDDHGMHYVPIAMLNKGPLLEFDTRDESGRAVPLLTLRKSAAIAAATLSSLAQSVVWLQLQHALDESRVTEAEVYPPDHLLIRLPREIEDEFMRIAHLPYQGEFGSRARMSDFLPDPPPPVATRPWQWKWTHEDGLWSADASDDEWRYELARHPKMRMLLEDFARLWMVSIPVKDAPHDRRIIKFSYFEHCMEPQVRSARRAKAVADRIGVGALLGRAEDWMEGLPRDESDREWRSRHTAHLGPDPIGIGLGRKICQALAWHGHDIVFEAPAVGKGGSYHLELLAPAGTQIRRATLAIVKPIPDSSTGSLRNVSGAPGAAKPDGWPALTTDAPIAAADAATPADADRPASPEDVRSPRNGFATQSDLDAIRGARSLQRAHLYVGNIAPGARGAATLTLKPRSSTIVRSLALLSLAAFAMLLVARLKLDALVGREDGAPAALVPFFLLIPGLGAAAVARGGEHAMTTSMLFGLRMLAVAAATSPLLGASLLAIARYWSNLAAVWTALVVVSGALAVLLLISWRLTSRRRPDGTVP